MGACISVRPGITDLATLQFRDEEACLMGTLDIEKAYLEVVVPIKVKLALEYVENRSFLFDLKILILTVWAITFGRLIAKPNNQIADLAREKIKNLQNN
jgi:lipopolysaccharide/colanic/teichoic acid biosynthesis glycosyltransferase